MENNTKKVLVTGGTGSVGISLINIFARNSYSVYFQYSNNADKAKELESMFSVNSFRMDFNSEYVLPSIDFDIIINNAGINISSLLMHEVSDRIWEETVRINLTAPFKISKFYIPEMITKKWGRIININSIYGLRGVENNSPYNAAKHGLSGLTKSIAKEYGQYGITCNEICPSAIESEMMNRIANEAAIAEKITPEEYLKSVRDEIPEKRMANPNDIATLALHLAQTEAGFINGCSIPVDGGLIC